AHEVMIRPSTTQDTPAMIIFFLMATSMMKIIGKKSQFHDSGQIPKAVIHQKCLMNRNKDRLTVG
ncbi:MAG: hypothetical protein C0403_19480, partial [Desulfobacterium sp.]|nr:hypothetical protein [Desulfobacterium sp.]